MLDGVYDVYRRRQMEIWGVILDNTQRRHIESTAFSRLLQIPVQKHRIESLFIHWDD